MQRIVTQQVKESKGERVDAVRISPEAAWGVFLLDIKRWCASADFHELVKQLPIFP